MALGVDGFRVGCWTDHAHATGCTVVLSPDGALGAMAVRGGAPGTREAAALGPTGSIRECHAIVLSGGSAFGLATADGVVDWCASHGIGYASHGIDSATAVTRVPIVGAAIVFDLRSADAPRPGRDAGWAACEAAVDDDPAMGAVGVGAGCTVGKTAGIEHAAKGGQGIAVARGGGVTVGALVAVNALGDVLDERGSVLAGSRAPAGIPRFPFVGLGGPVVSEIESTVVGCLVTDGRLAKHEAARAADLAHSGIARAIEPAHTTYDGDALFLLCAQRVQTTVDVVASLGAQAVSAAIRAAVRAVAPPAVPDAPGERPAP